MEVGTVWVPCVGISFFPIPKKKPGPMTGPGLNS